MCKKKRKVLLITAGFPNEIQIPIPILEPMKLAQKFKILKLTKLHQELGPNTTYFGSGLHSGYHLTFKKSISVPLLFLLVPDIF